ncbi:MAG: DUF2589 domain-containing protein [Desulfobacteraceae bacterium]|nr:DUF2589 domain-containing protein [Desulfobacteraceae bacterium]
MPEPITNPDVAALNAIDFSKIIGGPLTAAVNAQASAALVTMDFINKVGFSETKNEDQDGTKIKKLNNVTFAYSRQVPNTAGSSTSQSHQLAVPLLTMMPIPFIRIEDMRITFNAKIHSMTKSSEENTLTENSNVKFDSIWSPVSVNVTTTDKNVYNRNKETDQTYTMQVDVHAVQDTMPGGLAKILSIFEEVIEAQVKEEKKEDEQKTESTKTLDDKTPPAEG